MKNAILSIIAGFGILTHVGAQECVPCFESSYMPGEPLDPCCVIAGYPYPATTELCGLWDIYVNAEWIYWRAGKAGQAFAGTRQTTTGVPIIIDDIYGTPRFQSGFRVGAGVDLGPVLLDAKYTRWRWSSHETFVAGTGEIIRSNATPINNINLLSQDLKGFQKLDILDVAIKKPIYVGKNIIVDMRYGLLTMWQGQTRNNRYIQQTSSVVGVITSDDSTWTIGPNMGILSRGLIPFGFYVVGNFSGTLQIGKYTKNQSTISFPNLASTFNTSIRAKTLQFFVPQIFSQIGIGWNSYFFCDQLHVNFSVTYDSLFMSSGPHNAPNIGVQPYRSPVEQFHGFSIAGQLDF